MSENRNETSSFAKFLLGKTLFPQDECSEFSTNIIFDSLNGCTFHQIFIHCYSFDFNAKVEEILLSYPIVKQEYLENGKNGTVKVKSLNEE